MKKRKPITLTLKIIRSQQYDVSRNKGDVDFHVRMEGRMRFWYVDAFDSHKPTSKAYLSTCCFVTLQEALLYCAQFDKRMRA